MSTSHALAASVVTVALCAGPLTAQVDGGFDYITDDYVDSTVAYTSIDDTGANSFTFSTAQAWTSMAAVNATHLSVVWGSALAGGSHPQSPAFEVNVWSSFSAMFASPLAGDVFHSSYAAPDSGSLTQPIGFHSSGKDNYLIGFDLGDIELISGRTCWFGVLVVDDFLGPNVGGIVESGALSQPPGRQVVDFNDGQGPGWIQTNTVGGTSFNGVLAMKLDATVLHTPWTDLGGGVAGQSSKTPALSGVGNLGPDEPYEVNLTDARPNTTAALVLGLSQLSVPFKGGVLVPAPDVLVAGIPTGPEGGIPLGSTWPAGIPSGASVWFQWWVSDADGPVGFAASNGLQATAP